jgi:hypothetical protein
MDSWFIVNAGGTNPGRDPAAAPIRGKISEAQVYALPEITYQNHEPEEITVMTDSTKEGDGPTPDRDSEKEEQIEKENGNKNSTQEDGATAIDNDVQIRMGSDDTTNETTEGTSNTNETGTSLSSENPKAPFTYTISTTCSICIEEFEEGEKVRLLPRCGHGFHTECILPWLTNRQGCCPFCKTAVLESLDEELQDASEENVAESSQNQQEGGDTTRADNVESSP